MDRSPGTFVSLAYHALFNIDMQLNPGAMVSPEQYTALYVNIFVDHKVYELIKWLPEIAQFYASASTATTNDTRRTGFPP